MINANVIKSHIGTMIATAVVTLVFAIFFSDSFLAQTLTDYNDQKIIDGNSSELHITNIGLIQALDVTMSISMNNNSELSHKSCPGSKVVSDELDKEMNIEVESMIPWKTCEFRFYDDIGEYEVSIISAGRLTEWNSKGLVYNPMFVSLPIGVMLVVVGGAMSYMIRDTGITINKYRLAKKASKVFSPTGSENMIISYVDKEYGACINKKDAAIIDCIFQGKDTKMQIISKTNLPMRYLSHRLKQLNGLELIKLEPLTLDDTLFKFLEKKYSNSKAD